MLWFIKKSPKNNKIVSINSTLQHTSVASEYTDSVTESVIFFNYSNTMEKPLS